MTGSADIGSTVTVFADGSAVSGCTDVVVVDSGEGGSWDCPDVAIPFGTTRFRAQATTAGSVSPKSATITVVRFGTAEASINGPSSTNHRYPTFYGTGAELGAVSVYYGEGTACTADVETDGTWTCTSVYEFSLGDNSIWAYGTTYDGVEDPYGTSADIYVGLDVPRLKYTFSPAKFAFTLTGDSEAEVHSDVSRLFQGEGIDHDSIGNCPSNAETAVSSASCSFSNLDPGVYNAFSHQQFTDVETETYFGSDYRDDYVMVPARPTIGVPETAGGVTHFSGTGTPGYRVIVRSGTGDTVCDDIVSTAGNWSCTATLSAGRAAVRATQQSRGFDVNDYFNVGEGGEGALAPRSFNGLSAYTPTREFAVPYPAIVTSGSSPTPTPTPSPTPTPDPSSTPPAFVWNFSISGEGDGTYVGGEELTIAGDGPVDSRVSAELHSTPIPLGSTTVTADGTFSMLVKIPAGVDPGSHEIVVTITPPSEAPATAGAPVTIADPNAAAPTDDPTARNEPNAPALFTNSVKTVSDVLGSPVTIAAAAGAGLLLLMFVALPAELLNSTLEQHYERMFGRLPFLKRRTGPRFPGLVALFERNKIIGGVVLTALAAIIFGFADPGFGFDLASVRTVLASAIALFIVGYVASALTGLILRGRWEMVTTIELKPLGIVLTVIGVVLSRLLDFSPGFLFGLIIGLGMVGASSLAERVRLTLLNSAFIFGFAIIAWIGYSAIAGDTTGFWDTLGNDTLVAVTSEGLTALAVGLLPFRFLDGEGLFERSKALWAGVYLVAAAAFVLILIPAANNWGETTGPVWFWLSVLVVFSLVAFGIYLYFRVTHSEDESEHESEHEHATM
jgi:hypothetical protein